MKLNDESRFPHPVLSRDTGDYLTGNFEVSVSVAESSSPVTVTVDYLVTLTEPTLRKEVSEDNSSVGFVVTCLDTYYCRLVPLGLEGGSVVFEPGQLMGRVTLRPLVWARRPVPKFPLTNCHEEFGSAPISIAPGDILAIDDEIIINVGREKLAQLETIFTISESAILGDDELSVFLESDTIKILAAPNIYQNLNSLRDVGAGRTIILNSVYLPAVMEVLDSLKDSGSEYESLRWYKVFTAKCDHLGIKIDAPNLWKDAQKLLKMPFREINLQAPNILK